MQCSFDEITHTYTINGRIVPGVTSVLADLLPCWKASEWHLQRGQEVHACAALIVNGKRFENDPQIDGQVSAIRKFFKEVQPTPLAVEQQVYSEAYMYAGTMDMLLVLNGKLTVLDYKASISSSLPYQCAAYALADGRATHGVGVEIREDGTYAMSQVYDLKRYRQQWLALLATYNIRKQCGVKQESHE